MPVSTNTMAPKKGTKPKHVESDCDDDEKDYRTRRDRNNQAVKKSRFKTKQKMNETMQRVTTLKSQNEVLQEKVKSLNKELQFLKDLFLAHASNTQNPKFANIDLNKLLKEEMKEEIDDEDM